MNNNIRLNHKMKCSKGIMASLTVETALVLPLFVLFYITFLFYIQLFIVQEHIQKTITKTGLSLAKTAYVYSDFTDALEAKSFGKEAFGEYLDINLLDLADIILKEKLLKTLTIKDLDVDLINKSCITNGYNGLDFNASKILIDSENIDIIVNYNVKFPVPIFTMINMPLMQRVRLRAWNGLQVQPLYSVVEEEASDETMVYITDTGTVYHRNRSCSHINLSIKKVDGIPVTQRNINGGKYYPCEICGSKTPEETNTYYITSSGDRYHTLKTCSKLKRTVREVPLSEVAGRSPCKRCGK